MDALGISSKPLSWWMWKLANEGAIDVAVYELVRNIHGEIVGERRIDDRSVWGRAYRRVYSKPGDIRVVLPKVKAPRGGVSSVFDLGRFA